MVIAASHLQLDHVGIAVRDLDGAVARFSNRLGARAGHREKVLDDGVETVFFELGSASVELLGSLRDDSAVARFLERRGEGLHHLAFRVDDIAAEMERWRVGGAELIDERPRPGSRGRLVAFIHPRSGDGVLTELCQRTDPAP